MNVYLKRSMGVRVCSSCNEEIPRNHFYYNADTTPMHRRSYCMACGIKHIKGAILCKCKA